MRAGTAKEKIYVPVHTVRQTLDPEVRNNWLAYHSLTGSDTISQFSGHGKRSTWKTYVKYPELLKDLGRSDTVQMRDIEMFVIKIYNSASKATSVNDLRVEMFHRTNDLEKLPPTKDSLSLHIMRSNYQALIWYKADEPKPDIPQPEDCGWKVDSTGLSLRPQLMTLPPVPTACIELVTCGCKTTCSSQRCSCRKHNISCSAACSCQESCLNTTQPAEDSGSDDED